MRKPDLITIACVALVLAFAGTAPTAMAGDRPSPVVVELFTSQGCSSCPPAEALLGELSKRPDVLALELHVDYWDYIGWKDPFASHIYVERQRKYSSTLGSRYVYTPQMVVDGHIDVIGSDRNQVESAIDSAKKSALVRPSVALSRDGDTVAISIGGIDRIGAHDVFFLTYDAKHATEVARGENRGRTLVNTNIVREFDRVGNWTGKPLDLAVSLSGKKGDGGCAVIVQQHGAGPIVAAASLQFPRN
jgi:hypothetical protein